MFNIIVIICTLLFMSETVYAKKHSKPISLSQKGLALIIKFEGFNKKAFWDYKQWSVGFGSRGTKGEVISREEAANRLAAETLDAQLALNSHFPTKFTQAQYDALVSFSYNTGTKWMDNSELAFNINHNNWKKAAEVMQQYTKAGSKTLPALVKRRKIESVCFLSGVYND